MRRRLHPDLVLPRIALLAIARARTAEGALRADVADRRPDARAEARPAEAHGGHGGARLVVGRLEREVLRQLRLAQPLLRLLEVAQDPRVALQRKTYMNTWHAWVSREHETDGDKRDDDAP